jgi:anti-sigma B factor antagonist
MKKEIDEQICIITPEIRQIDVNNVGAFERELMNMLKEPFQCILDLQNITFIDSSGLGTLISALRSMNSTGREMIFCSANPAVEVLFKMVRLSQISTICGSREDAVNFLTEKE